MHVHRVSLAAQIDHSPSHPFADAIREAFGRRPRQAVDEKRQTRVDTDELDARIVGAGNAFELVARQAGPIGDDEHAVGLGLTLRRIDHDRARELCVGRAAKRERHPCGRSPVVIRPGLTERESDLTAAGGWNLDRLTTRIDGRWTIAVAKTVHSEDRIELVSKLDHDDRPSASADERRRGAQRVSFFAERLDPQCWPRGTFGLPAPGRGAELHCERAIVVGPGRAAIVVRQDGRELPRRGSGERKEGREGQDGKRESRNLNNGRPGREHVCLLHESARPSMPGVMGCDVRRNTRLAGRAEEVMRDG